MFLDFKDFTRVNESNDDFVTADISIHFRGNSNPPIGLEVQVSNEREHPPLITAVACMCEALATIIRSGKAYIKEADSMKMSVDIIKSGEINIPKYAKDTLMIKMDTRKRESITIGKDHYPQYNNDAEITSSINTDIRNLAFAINFANKQADHEKIKTLSESTKACVNHLKDYFVDIDVSAFTVKSALKASTPQNAPCPCGSGKQFKRCHGKS